MDRILVNPSDQTGKKKRPYIPVLMAVGLAIYTLVAKDIANSVLAMAERGWSGGYVLFFFSYPIVAVLIIVGGLLWLGALVLSATSAYRKDFLPIMLWLASATGSYLLCGWIWQPEQPVAEIESWQSNSAGTASSDTASVMVDSVNYMHERATEYTLYDVTGDDKKPVGGSIVSRLASGGAKGCCIGLPRTWRPGIKLRVEWKEADTEQVFPEKYVKELELPRYDHPADVYVVFYPKHDVEVFVSPAEPGHPEWAGRIKETPWDLCVAEQGQKVCKRAIPKPGLSLEEMRGFCLIDGMEPERCERRRQFCIEDYEDEKMCTNLVWDKK